MSSITYRLGGFPVKATRILKTIAIASVMAFSATSAFAADMTAVQKEQIQSVVKDYLVKNPDVIIQALQTYQQQQMNQARKTMEETQKTAPKMAKDLFHDAQSPMIGNADGKVTLVEFFDYQCPHCIEMTPVLEAIIKANPNVRVVFKEFPIRGAASEMAAKAALAANMQGKYFELHKALMGANRVLTQEDILKLAQGVGLDATKLKKDMDSDTVAQQIKANYKLAQALKLMGTPAIFVAKSTVDSSSPATAVAFIPGQVDQAQLEQVIKKVSG
jgi:protein-disulfide isomerase